MTSVWAVTLIRALIIALTAVYFARILSANISYIKGKKKILAIMLLFIPLIVPPLVPAYAFSAFAFNFQTKPFPNEILYFFIMLSRLLPIGILILILIPPLMSRSSLFCDKLLKQKNISLLQSINHYGLTFLCVFLFAFNEYEIASLMRIKHWTVTLFNAHAGGLVMNLTGSFQMALFPALTSLLAILLIMLSLKGKRYNAAGESQKPGSIFFIMAAVSSLIGWILPFSIILLNSFSGFQDALSGNWMRNEFLNSMLISVISTGCCLAIITGLLRTSKKIVFLFLVPGLFGALLLGLLFIFVFNMPALNSLKQTVLPLSFALILYGLPIGVLMIIFFQKNYSQIETPTMLLPAKPRKEIRWYNYYIPGILLSMPVFCYIWFDLTLSSMLAPASFTTVFPRIYNLMHYSENEKLSATVLITSLLPVLLYLILFSLTRLYIKRTAFRSVK